MEKLRAAMKSNEYYFRKEMESGRTSQEKLENSFRVMQDELKALKSRMNKAEEWISDMEDKMMEITNQDSRRKTKWENMKAIWDLWDNIKQTNLHIIGIK